MSDTYDKGTEQYLMAPFIESRQTYQCDCDSCRSSVKYHNLVKWLFWIGLFFPFATLFEIGLYIYVDVFLKHRIIFPNLTEQDYPTEYERKIYLERHLLKIQTETDVKDQIIPNIDESASSVLGENRNNDPLSLQKFRYQFLKQIATDIVDYHDYYRCHFLKWTLRCIGVLIAQCTIILMLIVICSSETINQKYDL